MPKPKVPAIRGCTRRTVGPEESEDLSRRDFETDAADRFIQGVLFANPTTETAISLVPQSAWQRMPDTGVHLNVARCMRGQEANRAEAL